MCSWKRCNTCASETTNSSFQCVWQKPHFQVKTLIEISVIVNVISTPIYYVIGHIVHEILLATTAEDLKRQSDVMLVRRKSLKHLMATSTTVSPESHQSGRGRIATFSTVSTVDDELSKSQRMARRCIKTDRLQGIAQVSIFAEDLEQADGSQGGDKFDSGDMLFQDLQSRATALNHRDRDHFLVQWPVDNSASRSALAQELEDVKKCSKEWIAKLKDAPQSTVGVRLLQLFVKDLIGRDSRQAHVFENQLTAKNISEKRMVTWGMKCFAFTFLCCLNCYLIFSCILYGRSKGNADEFLHAALIFYVDDFVFCICTGSSWQKGWLISSLVNLMVDMFINQGTCSS